jgi:mannose-1-phosphate guanylyltransferase
VRSLAGDNVTMIIEPQGHNTAPAIAAATVHVRATYGDDTAMIILPTDHGVRDDDAWHEAVQNAIDAARQHPMVLCGIVPDSPSTSYGYMHYTPHVHDGRAYAVREFCEKPNLQTAQRYVAQGYYLWNSGLVVARAGCVWDKLQHHASAWMPQIEQSYASAVHEPQTIVLHPHPYARVPNISFDYAVLEHIHDAYVVPMQCGWSDVGTWEALWQWLPHDSQENVIVGAVECTDSSGCYIYAQEGVTLRVEHQHDSVIIATHDGVLVRTMIKNR